MFTSMANYSCKQVAAWQTDSVTLNHTVACSPFSPDARWNLSASQRLLNRSTWVLRHAASSLIGMLKILPCLCQFSFERVNFCGTHRHFCFKRHSQQVSLLWYGTSLHSFTPCKHARYCLTFHTACLQLYFTTSLLCASRKSSAMKYAPQTTVDEVTLKRCPTSRLIARSQRFLTSSFTGSPWNERPGHLSRQLLQFGIQQWSCTGILLSQFIYVLFTYYRLPLFSMPFYYAIGLLTLLPMFM